jgi:hypothetical protein
VPLGHVIVLVLYFEPINPCPQEVIVDWIGTVYGTQAAFFPVTPWAAALPPNIKARSANALPIIFKIFLFFLLELMKSRPAPATRRVAAAQYRLALTVEPA